MARPLRTLAFWLAFLACMVTGAILVTGGDAGLRWFGIALLLLPALGLALLIVAHYLGQRARARQPP